jgi:hypothetical protein
MSASSGFKRPVYHFRITMTLHHHSVRRATKVIQEDTAQLKARIDRLCEQAGISLT